MDLDKIKEFIIKKHTGQTRWDGSPYHNHPIAVSELVDSPIEKAVALLHDVLEDTDTTEKEIYEICGEGLTAKDILSAVKTLTKSDQVSYAEYIASICNSSSVVRKVKLADLTHNLSDLKDGQRKDKYQLAQLCILMRGQYE